MISITKYTMRERNMLKAFAKVSEKLNRAESEVSYMTETGEYCLKHIPMVLSSVGKSIDELERAGIDNKRNSVFYEWAEEIINSGEKILSKEEIISSLQENDREKMYLMDEISHAKDVLLLEAGKVYLSLADKVEKDEEERVKAEKWIESNDGELHGGIYSNVFFEYAFKLAAEKDNTDKRASLEKRLDLIGRTEEECIRIFTNEQSEELMRLENLIAIIYTIKNIDWEKAFRETSYTEKVLSDDPSGLYPMHDEESKSYIRREIQTFSKRFRIHERATAATALKLVKENYFENITEVIFTDKGRKALLFRLNIESNKTCKYIPDENGFIMMSTHGIIITAFMLMCVFIKIMPIYALLVALPLFWTTSKSYINRFILKTTKEKPVLRLKMDSVSKDARTIVIVPALIANEETACRVMRQIETYGVPERNENVDFLLLADFGDSRTETEENDEKIRDRILEIRNMLNHEAGRKKYYYLHRKREYSKIDKIWMGRERKRGAIEDFNLLASGYENRFLFEGKDAEEIKNKYVYAITVDTDTQMLPGTIEKLIGAIHHPLNRKYNIIQPRMELNSEKCQSRFARFLVGSGGSDIYNACSQDPYMDFTGYGLFNGKGIYRIREFLNKTNYAFDDNTVLSHDLIEGILAGCAYAGNIVLYEGFPQTVSSYMKRLERWTRGDWQLLRYAFGKLRLRIADIYKIIDNVIRSLSDASVLSLMLLSAWFGNTKILILAGFLFILPYVSKRPALGNLFARISLLPDTAVTCISAAMKALYRMFISHKNMLSWVTADDADKIEKRAEYTGIVYALLLLPAVFTPLIGIVSAVLSVFFVFGSRFLRENDRKQENFTLDEYAFLTDLAEGTWKYFEKNVKPGKTALPPDNVQLDPPKGAAMRTSPTNIAMYIASTISAGLLDLINESEMHARLTETAKEIKRLDKWNGLLFNWYDLHTMKPMHPKYVSSVDCGNLLAAYVLARNKTKKNAPDVSEMYSKLLKEAEIEKLFDERKNLFRIGYDAEKNHMSESHYDLIASEARILSYTAMAEKQVGIKHWRSLSRPCGRFMNNCVLKSWSGTMFEYLMPFLFLPSAKGTLFSQTAKGVIALQEKNSAGNIWGISESGYMSFDGELNYQYKAFGIGELALSGEGTRKVISPYAAVLALPLEKRKAVENLISMRERKLIGEYGFYEAIDFTASESGETVFSFMSHHQGMALCALTNALTDNALQKIFMEDAKEEALRPCLNEKPFRIPFFQKKREDDENDAKNFPAADKIRERNYHRRFSGREDYHFMISNDTEAFLNDQGEGFFRRNGIYANEWKQESGKYGSKLIPEIMINGCGMKMKGGEFAPGTAVYFLENKFSRGEITCTLSPENGSLIMKAECTNLTAETIDITFEQGFKAALCDENSIFAHPVFKDLFIETLMTEPGKNVLSKRRRDKNETVYKLIHVIYGVQGEMAEKRHPKQGIRSAVIGKGKIEPFGKIKAFFEISLHEPESEAGEKEITEQNFRRAQSLSTAFNKTILMYSGLNSFEYRNTEYAIGRIFTIESKQNAVEYQNDLLWPLGLAGDQAICLAIIKDMASLKAFRRMLRVYEFVREHRISIPLVIVHVSEVEYFTPLKDKIETMLTASRVSDLKGVQGGIYLISENDVTESQMEKLNSLSVLTVKNDFLKDTQIKRKAKQYECTKEKLRMNGRTWNRNLLFDNGIGGFDTKNAAYEITRSCDINPVTAWANFLVNPSFGAIATDRGIGCLWHGNSREGRITPYYNDPEDKKQTVRIDALIKGKVCPLFPGYSPEYTYIVRHSVGETVYRITGEFLDIETTVHTDYAENILVFSIKIASWNPEETEILLNAEADFMMGTDVRDKRFLKTETRKEIQIASGRKSGFAFAGFKDGDFENARSCVKRIRLKEGENKTLFFIIGYADSPRDAEEMFKTFDPLKSQENTRKKLKEYYSSVMFSTSDSARDFLMNSFVKHQTMASRVFGKCGFYQPGGAIGFRDQLQDMLAVMYFDPMMARSHILNCAAHQFVEGDAMHWWHEPASGVRTKISDDVLFLAYVASKYIALTQDFGILDEEIPYLKSVPIPDGQEDIYFEGEISDRSDTLRGHIMAAFSKAYRKGAHGLILMGSGDWNDGMNRVGAEGKGESVWLSEFMIVCAKEFMVHADESGKAYLSQIILTLKDAVEKHAWDGKWYLRAINDEGQKIGSHENKECRIDLISQAWAVLAELDSQRSLKAIKSAKELLYDKDVSIIRLLDPPFEGLESDPGYISKYPKGVRENGGQYTHAACWYVKALAKMGFANEAWKAFDLLLPIKRTDSEEKAKRYMAEPYVISADISGSGEWTGVGGWTWYTGAAAWTFCVLLEDLLGVKKEGNRITMHPLLPDDMNEAEVQIRFGTATFRLIGIKDEKIKAEEITMTDDGKIHEILFPARKNSDESILKRSENCAMIQL